MADWNEVERVPQLARDWRFPDYRDAPRRRDVLHVTVVIELVKAFPEWQQRAIERGTEQTISQNERARAAEGRIHRAPVNRVTSSSTTESAFASISALV